MGPWSLEKTTLVDEFGEEGPEGSLVPGKVELGVVCNGLGH